MGFWNRLFRKATPDRVTWDEIGVTRTRRDGVEESVRWDQLVEVGILTTGDGPLFEDVFWILRGADGDGCAVPQESEGSDQLLARLQQLPGFDNEMVIEAMSSTSENRFVCWRRSEDA